LKLQLDIKVVLFINFLFNKNVVVLFELLHLNIILEMKKNILKLTLITFITFFSIEIIEAQQNEFTLSSSDSKENHSFQVFGIDSSSFYTFHKGYDGPLLYESYTIKDLRSQIKTQINLPEINGEKSSFEKIIYINRHIYLFTSLVNKKKETYSAYVNEISIDGQLNPKA
jgi:hypothetical protein